MIKRVLFTSMFAAQFLTVSAMRTEDALRPLDCKAGSHEVALTRADDPIPCPECEIGFGPGLKLAKADDPIPCPECEIGFGPGMKLARADDPIPCPECEIGFGPGLKLARAA